MLKASSSGILLTRLLAQTNGRFVFVARRSRPCLLLPHVFHVQSRSRSSFFARFATRFAVEAEEGSSDTTPPFSVLMSRDARKEWIPWSAVQSAGRATAPSKGAGRRIKRTGEAGDSQEKRGADTSKHKLRVGPTRTQGRHGPSQKSTDVVNVRDEEKPTAKSNPEATGKTRQKRTELDKTRQISSVGVQTQENVPDVDPHIQRLRGVVFNKKSDLMEEAWDAYQQLLGIDADEDFNAQHDGSLVDDKLLITLANRLVKERKYRRKNSREIFLRLLSVYARLRRVRERVEGVAYLKSVEWNCLIHFAGTGLRSKASLDCYNAALDVYEDMLRGTVDAKAAGFDSLLENIKPDIYTYTTILSIALRSEHQPAIDHAMALLRDSGEKPTHVTHLCTMRYRHRLEGLAAAREVLTALHPDDVQCDGILAFMDCAGSDGELSVVQNIYAALRRNVEVHDDGTCGPSHNGEFTEGDPHTSDTSALEDTEKYMTVEGLRFSRTLVPNEALYNYVIQIYAYYGRLTDALQVFTEMLVTRRPPPGTGFFQPTYAVFRGLFLGFARYGYRSDKLQPSMYGFIERNPEWTWDRFNVILDAFFDVSNRVAPSERMVYWIMVSVRRITGDEETLRQVWQRLNERWYIRKGGRLKTLDIKYGKLEEEPMYRNSIDAGF